MTSDMATADPHIVSSPPPTSEARPTFGEADRIPEIHLFDASGDWYGDAVWVEFVARLRDTVRFAGVKELTEQLSRDASQARVALTQA